MCFGSQAAALNRVEFAYLQYKTFWESLPSIVNIVLSDWFLGVVARSKSGEVCEAWHFKSMSHQTRHQLFEVCKRTLEHFGKLELRT
jgi:hypothetical protein